MDLGAQLRDLDLAREQRDERAQARDRVGLLEQGDAIVEAEIGTGAGDVGDQLGLRGARHRDRGVGADLGAGVDVVGEQRAHRSEERVHLGALDGLDGHRRDGRDPGVAGGVEGIDADALLALDERVRAATRQPPEGADVGDDGDACARRRCEASSRSASRWMASTTRPSPFTAASSAATERGRPAASGASCEGKTTLSRSGTAGSVSDAGAGRGRSRVGGRRWLDVGHPNRIAGASGVKPRCGSPVSQSRRQAAA